VRKPTLLIGIIVFSLLTFSIIGCDSSGTEGTADDVTAVNETNKGSDRDEPQSESNAEAEPNAQSETEEENYAGLSVVERRHLQIFGDNPIEPGRHLAMRMMGVSDAPPGHVVFGIRFFSTELTTLDLSRALPEWGSSRESIAYDFQWFDEMINLTELRLWDSLVDDITPLSGLKNLTVLSLGDNNISDLAPLSELTNLTHLNLYGNQINDISPLSELTNLTHLTLQGNYITDLTPLADLKNLVVLELDDNILSDISPLSELTNLTELTLSDNNITDITPLSGLNNLRYLCLNGNPQSGNTGDTQADKTESISVKVGDTIEFGGLTWVVLDEDDNHAFIITENLQMMGLGAYNYKTTATWGTSFIRDYLNGEFYNRFTPSERQRIRETLVVNESNPWFRRTGGGEDTTDKIFLLSIKEGVQYFGDSGQLENRPGEVFYISDEFTSVRRTAFDDGKYWFHWFRTIGSTKDLASGIDGAGNINVFGTGINNEAGTRPVMWINLEG